MTVRVDAPDGALIFEWPLSLDPASLLAPEPRSLRATDGLTFVASSEVAALRELRAGFPIDATYSALGGRIREGIASYIVYIRDELPDDMRASIEAAWQSARL